MTSTLFATVCLHAYYLQCTSYHHTFLLVTVFSIWFHCTHDPIIAIVDKILAHFAFLLVLMETPEAVQRNRLDLLGFPALTLGLWVLEFVFPDRRYEIHVWLHVVSVLGLHCFLIALHGKGHYYL